MGDKFNKSWNAEKNPSGREHANVGLILKETITTMKYDASAC